MNPEQRFNDATQKLARGDYAAAAEGFRMVMADFPSHGPTLNNLAACLFSLGKYGEALAIFSRLTELAPANPLSHYNTGRCLRALGRDEEAARSYGKALALDPAYAEARENLANVLTDLGRYEAALNHYIQGMKNNPARADNYRQAALIHKDKGEIDKARACLERGISNIESLRGPGADGLRILHALLLAPIAADAGQIHEARQALHKDLASLLEADLTISDPAREIGFVPFFLAYHGEDDRALNEMMARLYRRACPSLCVEAPHVTACVMRERPRIGVVTAHAGEHSVARFFNASLAALAQQADVQTYYVGHEKQVLGDDGSLPSTALPDSLFQAQEVLAAAQLDLLIYPEIGIHPLVYFLAHARLAPVQIALYGHPVTTGNPAIDYFLSHAGCEPHDAAQHYSEKLLLLPAQVTYARLRKRSVSASHKSRADFGLPKEAPLYLCAQSLFKLHPDFDTVLAAIMRRDPKGKIVMFAGRDHWGQLLKKRLQRHLPDLKKRLHLLPYQSLPDFLAVAACCDIALDTYPFSGGSTSFDCLQQGLPIVTLPGRLMRSRQTASLYARMAIDELTAHSVDDYIEKAVTIANDRALRQQLSAKILAGHDMIFDDDTSSSAFCQLILGTLTDRISCPPRAPRAPL